MINEVSLDVLRGPIQAPAPPRPTDPKGSSFSAELRDALSGPGDVRFSAHAVARLEARGIGLSESDRARISQAFDAAAAKGAREALLVMDGIGMVVSVPNRTVITVLEPEGTEPAVFTNIDSAVLVPGEASASPQSKPKGLDLI